MRRMAAVTLQQSSGNNSEHDAATTMPMITQFYLLVHHASLHPWHQLVAWKKSQSVRCQHCVVVSMQPRLLTTLRRQRRVVLNDTLIVRRVIMLLLSTNILQVASGGVVRDPKVHKAVIETVCSGIAALGFTSEGHIESPIKGASSGNKEFLAWFQKL